MMGISRVAEFSRAYRATLSLLNRAMEVDRRYAALGLGLVDASIVALAEEVGSPRLELEGGHQRADYCRRGDPIPVQERGAGGGDHRRGAEDEPPQASAV